MRGLQQKDQKLKFALENFKCKDHFIIFKCQFNDQLTLMLECKMT